MAATPVLDCVAGQGGGGADNTGGSRPLPPASPRPAPAAPPRPPPATPSADRARPPPGQEDPEPTAAAALLPTRPGGDQGVHTWPGEIFEMLCI